MDADTLEYGYRYRMRNIYSMWNTHEINMGYIWNIQVYIWSYRYGYTLSYIVCKWSTCYRNISMGVGVCHKHPCQFFS